MREVPGPARIAPYSAALSIGTNPEVLGHEDEATSTLAILYDTTQADLWGGPFRLVGQLRARIDADMSTDPLLGDVLWRGLEQVLKSSVPQDSNGINLLMGTVTRELSETFGGLELQRPALNVEIRCSWTPTFSHDTEPDLSLQVSAWADYVLQVAAIPGDEYFGLEVHDG